MRLSLYPKLIDPEVINESLIEDQTPQKSSNKSFLYFISLVLTVITVLFIIVVGNLNETFVTTVSKFLETIPFFDLRLSTELIKELKFPSPVTSTIFAGNICFLSFAAFDLFYRQETRAKSNLFRESSAVSYSIHLTILLIILLVLFVSYRPKPKIQITKIEFIQTQTPSKTPPPKKTTRKSTQQSIDAGKHDPKRKITPAAKPPGEPGAPAKPTPPAKPKAAPKQITPPNETQPTPPTVNMPTPKPMLPKPKALRDAVEPLPEVDPNAKTLPKLLNYTPNSNSASSNSSSAPAPKSSDQADGSSGRSSNIVSQLSNIPRAPDSMGGSGSGGAYGTPGNPPPNAYPDRAPSLASNASVNFGPYMSALQRKIKMAWKPPRGTESNRIVVTFSVLQNGRLENLQMIVASQDASANQAALEAVTRASPFEPLPSGAGPKVDVEFTFDYNVFQKTRF